MRAHGTLAEVADATTSVGMQRYLLGDLESAEAALRVSIELWQEAHDLRGEAIALDNLAEIQRHVGDLDQASRTIGQAIELAEQSGNAHAIVLCRQTQVQLWLEMGRVGVSREDDHRDP